MRRLDGTVEKRFSKKEILYPLQVPADRCMQCSSMGCQPWHDILLCHVQFAPSGLRLRLKTGSSKFSRTSLHGHKFNLHGGSATQQFQLMLQTPLSMSFHEPRCCM